MYKDDPRVLDRSDYSDKDQYELAKAVVEANDIEDDLEKDLKFNCPFAQATPKRVAYESWQEAVMANVNGGVGPVFVGRRGDLDVAKYVLKHKDSSGKNRFKYHVTNKSIIEGWSQSNKFWLYQRACPDYDLLVRRMRRHSALADWDIEDKGVVPMDFVCTDRQIFDHVRRENAAGNIDYATTNPDHFFCKNRGITSMAKWVAEKRAEYEEDSSW